MEVPANGYWCLELMTAEHQFYLPTLGKAGKAAVNAIKAERPDLQQVASMEEGGMVTMDFREDRVRVMVDGDGNVSRAPTVG